MVQHVDGVGEHPGSVNCFGIVAGNRVQPLRELEEAADHAAISFDDVPRLQGGGIEAPVEADKHFGFEMLCGLTQGGDLSDRNAARLFKQDLLDPGIQQAHGQAAKLVIGHRDDRFARWGQRSERILERHGQNLVADRFRQAPGRDCATTEDRERHLLRVQHLGIGLRHWASPEQHHMLITQFMYTTDIRSAPVRRPPSRWRP